MKPEDVMLCSHCVYCKIYKVRCRMDKVQSRKKSKCEYFTIFAMRCSECPIEECLKKRGSK